MSNPDFWAKQRPLFEDFKQPGVWLPALGLLALLIVLALVRVFA